MESAHRCVCKLPLVSAFISKMCEIKPRMHLSLQTATYTLLIRDPPPTIYQLPPAIAPLGVGLARRMRTRFGLASRRCS